MLLGCIVCIGFGICKKSCLLQEDLRIIDTNMYGFGFPETRGFFKRDVRAMYRAYVGRFLK